MFHTTTTAELWRALLFSLSQSPVPASATVKLRDQLHITPHLLTIVIGLGIRRSLLLPPFCRGTVFGGVKQSGLGVEGGGDIGLKVSESFPCEQNRESMAT